MLRALPLFPRGFHRLLTTPSATISAAIMDCMSFVLALDAGGTRTECVMADGERVLSRVRGGSIKIIRVPPEEARATLFTLLDQVVEESGVSLDRVCATCAGISGFSIPAITSWMGSSLEERVAGRIVLCGDDEIALDAAFPGQRGVLVLAGTGSNILARTSDGQRFNVGGWGPVLSDEGSGYWIGLQALRAMLHACDRGERTLLLARVATFWGVQGTWGIVERAHATPPPDFAALAPLVEACAEEGDAVCLEVLAAAGRHLADAAVLAIHKMRALEPEASVIVGVALAGGVLRASGILRMHVMEEIRRQLPHVAILPEPVDPIVGALWRARQACV